MKRFNSVAAAGIVLALMTASARAGDTPQAATPAPPAATAVPAPVPATRPGTPAPEAKAEDPKAPAAPDNGAAAVGQGSGWNAEVATPGGGIVLSDAQVEIVKKVNAYFNALGDMKGTFVQTTADNKRMKGKFMVKRPGRFRFDYALPSKQIIISDGEYLAIQDLDLNNEDRVSLDQTPFRLLLRKDVDLVRDAKIVEVQESDDQLVLALSDKSPDAPGKIKLLLGTKPEIELKEWVTTDAQGLDTRVEVSQLSKGEPLDAKLFKIEAVSLNNFHP
ncbi:outer membrane lipoprotein carrier protein LolA [Hyphomicrobium sp.]|uniref:LolA family protein n=1 Tax=Hyphomicrobium sp. TaxID=82 RepID=UPI002E36AA32|nr:outer membrane lipoprotein carrier protein LolA [Hyphomicrobium sp.]HEX2842465.1 outer membrane lipoprotein carrier protein LolA [Hyphomicrobium sp.]